MVWPDTGIAPHVVTLQVEVMAITFGEAQSVVVRQIKEGRVRSAETALALSS
jgi:hypothetical protein